MLSWIPNEQVHLWKIRQHFVKILRYCLQSFSKSKPSIGKGFSIQKATPFQCNIRLFPMLSWIPNDQVHLFKTSQQLVGMPRHCPKSFWSLKLDFGNNFPAKTPKALQYYYYYGNRPLTSSKFWWKHLNSGQFQSARTPLHRSLHRPVKSKNKPQKTKS